MPVINWISRAVSLPLLSRTDLEKSSTFHYANQEKIEVDSDLEVS